MSPKRQAYSVTDFSLFKENHPICNNILGKITYLADPELIIECPVYKTSGGRFRSLGQEYAGSLYLFKFIIDRNNKFESGDRGHSKHMVNQPPAGEGAYSPNAYIKAVIVARWAIRQMKGFYECLLMGFINA